MHCGQGQHGQRRRWLRELVVVVVVVCVWAGWCVCVCVEGGEREQLAHERKGRGGLERQHTTKTTRTGAQLSTAAPTTKTTVEDSERLVAQASRQNLPYNSPEIT